MKAPECFDCKRCRFTVSLETPKRSYRITLCKLKGWLFGNEAWKSSGVYWCDDYYYYRKRGPGALG